MQTIVIKVCMGSEGEGSLWYEESDRWAVNRRLPKPWGFAGCFLINYLDLGMYSKQRSHPLY